jgi:hypothetical protein
MWRMGTFKIFKEFCFGREGKKYGLAHHQKLENLFFL